MCNMFRDDDRLNFQIDNALFSLMKHYSLCHTVARVLDLTVLINITAVPEQQRRKDFPLRPVFSDAHIRWPMNLQ